MKRSDLLLAVAKLICHCDGHIWLPKPNPQRQAIQQRYLSTAERILELIDAK
jgi:hypothetical protein